MANQKRLLENLIATSRMLRASEDALEVYREQILEMTEKKIGKGAKAVLQYWTFSTKDGWARK